MILLAIVAAWIIARAFERVARRRELARLAAELPPQRIEGWRAVRVARAIAEGARR